ncbi:AAA family ATPase, partial [bacterium]|nr:AAA family ATPase [bacterium]
MMKILELNIKGFRSLKDVTWKPGDLNVLIGPNASGKSNLLRCLEFISASAEGKLGDYVKRAGGMEPLVWDGKADAISFFLESSSLDKFRESERNLTYQLEISQLGFSNHKVNYELLGNFYKYKQGITEEPFKFIERSASFAVVFDENDKKLTPPANSYKEEESILSLATGLFLTNHHISLYRQELLKWHIYHDIHVNQDAEIRRPAVAKYEKTVNPDGQNLIPVLHTLYTGDRDFKKAVDAAMSTAFG